MQRLRWLLLAVVAHTSCVVAEVAGAEHGSNVPNGVARFHLNQLQGAWWTQEPSPTAAFAIDGDQAWFDYDNNSHPVRIEGDILIFDHGPSIGLAKSKILAVGGGILILQDIDDPSQIQIYTSAEPSR